MRIFLDANVLFSAAKSDGAIRQLLETLLHAGHECWADGYVVEEANRNLMAKCPGGLEPLARHIQRLNVAVVVRDTELESRLPLTEKDRPVLAAAIRLDCDALITGDRTHFGDLYGTAVHGVEIHSPRSLARVLRIGGVPGDPTARQRVARYKVRRRGAVPA